MRRTWAITKKELQLYFYSPLAYVAFAFYFLLNSFFFANDFLSTMIVDVRMIFSNIMFFFLFVIPLLTMRLVSDEMRHGTDELLLTSPASLTEIVLGKYMASIIMLLFMVGFSFIYPLILSAYGKIDQPVMWLSYLSVFLIGCVMMAVGLFASTLSSHQLVSGIISFGILIVLWLISSLGYSMFPKAKDIFEQFSIVLRATNMQKGVLNLADVLFYVTLSALFVVLSIQSLGRKRWR